MAEFQKQVAATMRTSAEVETERHQQTRSNGVGAFVDATNTPDGGAYGYQSMLEHLFQVFESDYGAGATINTVLEALKPVLRHHHDLSKVKNAFTEILDDVDSAN